MPDAPSITRRFTRLRRLAVSAFLLALLSVLAVFAGPPAAAVADDPPAAEPVDLTQGTLTWGVRSTFRSYAGGGVPSDGAELVNPADPTSSFRWPLESGSFDPGTQATIVQFGGKVHFQSHCGAEICELDMSVARPRLELTPDGAALYADVISREFGGAKRLISFEDVEFAALNLRDAELSVGEDLTKWQDIAATLTADGYPAFAGFYEVGAQLDPVSFEYSGPGGRPIPTVETWTPLGTPRFEEQARAELAPYRLAVDQQQGLLHTWDGGSHLQALDLGTLEVVAETEAPINFTILADDGQPWTTMSGYAAASNTFFGLVEASSSGTGFYEARAATWNGSGYDVVTLQEATNSAWPWSGAGHPGDDDVLWYRANTLIHRATHLADGSFERESWPNGPIARVIAVAEDGTVIGTLSGGGLAAFEPGEDQLEVQPIAGTAGFGGSGSGADKRVWSAPTIPAHSLPC